MIRRFARPYAKAIMETTGTPAVARSLHAELVRFETARDGSPDLAAVFDNPAIDHKVQLSIVEAIAAKLQFSERARRILEVLLRNDRLNDLGSILEALDDMINTATNTVIAEVRSAHALDESEKTKLVRALEAKLGRTVHVEVAVDPALLGGFVATVGSEVFDASVVARIQKIRKKSA